ncbi:abortive infection family protein [uncultured Xanthomonas sp.]|uniref:abortive infection family protein n=1 Tax=uncultured Xanthomonas sp. TaxID=152831 RepID=UPI0025EADBA4|nr:abortive infection family protein [uncultured Xanthomonas sp.]
MNLDWCPGIREACVYWHDAPMLRQTFEALENTLDQDNDTCIGCSKAVVEVICQTIVASFHSQQNQLRPKQDSPTLSDWLSSAVKALRLGDVRDDKFRKLVSSYHKLSDALNDLRNKADPASHGKDPYLERLAVHHRRSAVLAADAIVTFLHKAYLDSRLDPACSREPWERFEVENSQIDQSIGLTVDNQDDDSPTLRFLLPGGEELPIKIEVSRLLYILDRDAYVEALNAARSTSTYRVEVEGMQGED